jgi:hypothetical protein
MSVLKPIIHTTPFVTNTTGLMQHLNIDAMGPYPDDEFGDKYILVIIDRFSRFIELYKMKDVSAAEAANALVQHCGRYGYPTSLLTDNGSQFDNHLLAEIAQSVGFTFNYTLPYSKEENGLVERANKEVLRHLRAFVFEATRLSRWGRFLPMVQRIVNSTVHEAIGVAPAQLLFGSMVNLDRGVFINLNTQQRVGLKLNRWVDEMVYMQAKLIQKADELQFARNNQHLVNPVEPITEYPVNSFVMRRYPRNSLSNRSAPTKLQGDWRGPLRVLRRVGAHEYVLINLTNNREERAVVNDLKPFLFDPEVTDPAEVARRDLEEFVVQEVLEHRGSSARRGAMTFRVRWEGYPAESDSWESYANLRETAALHRYLVAHGMANLVPEQFRESTRK